MILDRLREETRPAHEQLEKRIDLLGRPWSLGFYRLLLQKFFGLYAVLEPAIIEQFQRESPNFDMSFDIESRRKLGLLRHDLQSLGLSNRDIEALPLCVQVLVPTNFAQALGCAYVLEGSTLGGQIITRHLKRELGAETSLSCEFFGSYGVDVGPMWREFVQFLNASELDSEQENQLIASACATFATFERWMLDIL